MGTSKLVVTDEGHTRTIFMPLAPRPAARARVGRYGTFYPKNYATWKAEAKEMLEPYRLETPYTHPVRAIFTYVVSKPAKPARVWPRGDIDNYEKAIMDAITSSQCYWYDDVAVTCVHHRKRYAGVDEMAHVQITLMEDPAYD